MRFIKRMFCCLWSPRQFSSLLAVDGADGCARPRIGAVVFARPIDLDPVPLAGKVCNTRFVPLLCPANNTLARVGQENAPPSDRGPARAGRQVVRRACVARLYRAERGGYQHRALVVPHWVYLRRPPGAREYLECQGRQGGACSKRTRCT